MPTTPLPPTTLNDDEPEELIADLEDSPAGLSARLPMAALTAAPSVASAAPAGASPTGLPTTGKQLDPWQLWLSGIPSGSTVVLHRTDAEGKLSKGRAKLSAPIEAIRRLNLNSETAMVAYLVANFSGDLYRWGARDSTGQACGATYKVDTTSPEDRQAAPAAGRPSPEDRAQALAREIELEKVRADIEERRAEREAKARREAAAEASAQAIALRKLELEHERERKDSLAREQASRSAADEAKEMRKMVMDLLLAKQTAPAPAPATGNDQLGLLGLMQNFMASQTKIMSDMQQHHMKMNMDSMQQQLEAARSAAGGDGWKDVALELGRPLIQGLAWSRAKSPAVDAAATVQVNPGPANADGGSPTAPTAPAQQAAHATLPPAPGGAAEVIRQRRELRAIVSVLEGLAAIQGGQVADTPDEMDELCDLMPAEIQDAICDRDLPRLQGLVTPALQASPDLMNWIGSPGAQQWLMEYLERCAAAMEQGEDADNGQEAQAIPAPAAPVVSAKV